MNAAGSEQPAVAARWWVAVPHRAARGRARDPVPPRDRSRRAADRRGARISARPRTACGRPSSRRRSSPRPGSSRSRSTACRSLAALWERFHPAARELPDMARARRRDHDRERDDRRAGRRSPPPDSSRRSLTARATRRSPRPIRGGCEHADGTFEEVLHLGTPPLHTSLWWLMHLLACPLPVTVAVHIRVGSREQIRARQRRRWRRLSASIDYKHRRAHLVGARGARGARRSRAARLRARRRDRRDRLQGLGQRRDPRPARPRRRVRNAREGDRPRVPGAHRRSGHPRPLALAARTSRPRSRSASTRCARPGPTRNATSRTASR